jgi:1,4-dihydroxy-2-naphthoyl-CoA synthase
MARVSAAALRWAQKVYEHRPVSVELGEYALVVDDDGRVTGWCRIAGGKKWTWMEPTGRGVEDLARFAYNLLRSVRWWRRGARYPRRGSKLTKEGWVLVEF